MGKLFVKMAIPGMIGMLVVGLYNLVDSIFVGGIWLSLLYSPDNPSGISDALFTIRDRSFKNRTVCLSGGVGQSILAEKREERL